MSKFVFDNKDILNFYITNEEELKKLVKTNKFILSEDCLKYLLQNHRETYKNICQNYKENKPLFEIEKYFNDYGILTNSYINSLGVIITNCNNILVNGGCKCNNSEITYSNFNLNHYNTIISIAAKWASDTWHFPFEALVALKTIPKNILSEAQIHVSKKTKYIIEWLNLLDIKDSQIISGNVFAKKLYLPRMGKCGNPYYSQILWLKNILIKKLPKVEKLDYVILIKRNYRRKSENFQDLVDEINIFVKNQNLKLYIHDDSCLPSLTKQQEMFSKAKYVFAEHGAGGIHMISMNKNAWYIEFLNPDINICYSRLAYLLDINYIGISNINLISNIKKIYKTILK